MPSPSVDPAAAFVTEEADQDLDLFGEETDTASADFQNNLRRRADLARREKLAQLPTPSRRTCAQNRTAYVLSGHRLQPTKVSHVLAPEECELVLAGVVAYVGRQGGLQTARHEKFATTDVAVSDLSLALGPSPGDSAGTVGGVVLEWVSDRILRRMAEATNFQPHNLGLKDLFVVCYCGNSPGPERHAARYPIPSKQASLAIHSDGCLLSFSLLLNDHESFQGGGTYFRATGQTYLVERGGLLMHDAGLEREWNPRLIADNQV